MLYVEDVFLNTFSDIISILSLVFLVSGLTTVIYFRKNPVFVVRFPYIIMTEIILNLIKTSYVALQWGNGYFIVNSGPCVLAVILPAMADVPGRVATTTRLLLYYKQAKVNCPQQRAGNRYLDMYVRLYAYLVCPGDYFRLENQLTQVNAAENRSDIDTATLADSAIPSSSWDVSVLTWKGFWRNQGRFYICLFLHWAFWSAMHLIAMYSAITPEQSWLRHWDSTCVPPVFKVIGAYYIFWGVSNLPMFLMMFDTSGDRIGFRVELLLNLCILTISSVVDGILLIAVTRTGGLWAIYFDQITLMLPPVLSFLIPLGFIAKRYLKDQCNFTLPRRKRNDRPQKSGDIRLTSPQDLENLWRKDFKEEINRAARKHLLVDYVMYLEQSDNIERLSPGRYKHLYNTFVHPASLYELQISSDSRQRFGMYVGSPNADLKRNIVNEVRTSVFAYLYASIKNDLEMELRKENVSEKVVV